MRHYAFAGLAILTGACLVLVTEGQVSGQGKGGKANMDKMVESVTQVLPDKGPATPKQPRKILIYTRVGKGGFVHSSIEIGARTLVMLGDKTGAYSAVSTNNVEMFAPDKLNQFDGVFLVSNTADFLRPDGDPKEAAEKEAVYQKSLMDFVKGGKGLMGLHAATDSYHKTWPEFAGLLGGTFQSHPWTKLVPIKNVEPNNPVNAAFEGKDFEVDDEIYQFVTSTAKPTERRILLQLDTAKMPDAGKGNRGAEGPYPVSWISNYDKGRVFYCSLGHREQIFWNSPILKHYLAGIQFALGDLQADASPSKAPTTQPEAK